MERNWLIRTSQNQILGPVAKSKLLEFIEKGALGLNDEVASGNGYWISIKERDLVEKYLYGDVPQGYNPISESKSVLAQRENPDKTTSLNTAPPNKTQVLKNGLSEKMAIPKDDDLEYPDLTLVSTDLSQLQKPMASTEDDIKIPDAKDLEFPDITLVATPLKSPVINQPHVDLVLEPIKKAEAQPISSVNSAIAEDFVYPEDDDLAYPDFTAPSPAVEPSMIEEEQRTFVVESKAQKEPVLELMPEIPVKPEKVVPEKEKVAEPGLSLVKKSEEKKLLHERKVKASAKETRVNEAPRPLPDRSMPEHLKKRNDNYLMYLLIILVLIILSLFFYYYSNILNKPLPV